MNHLFWTIVIVLIVIGLAMMYPKPKKMTEQEVILLIQAQKLLKRPQIVVNDTVYSTGYSYGGNDAIFRSAGCGC